MNSKDLFLARLLAETEQLNANVRALLETIPHHSKVWLEPRELARLLGVSVRTIANWREQGRFRPGSYRAYGRGFQYHATAALADAQGVAK